MFVEDYRDGSGKMDMLSALIPEYLEAHHRIGQTRNVEVIKLIAGESIEQRVVELQDMKKEVIKQVISDDDGSVTRARLEDIAFVLD
jgi:non-specific serine/threonine protein kinase